MSRRVVGLLTLAVSLLALPALADPAPTASATPLALRPAQATESTPTTTTAGGVGWKLFAGAGAIALIAWAFKKQRARKHGPERPIRVVSRTSIGVRSDLLVVEVEGQLLFLGVTPGSIQRLAVLGAEPVLAAEQASEEEAPATLADRFGTLLEGSTGAPRRVVAGEGRSGGAARAVEGQALGLLALVKARR